jgi:cell division transport system permease protein
MKNKLITLYRIIRTGLVNFFRNLSLAVAAVAVMVVTLTLILFLVIANAAFGNTIQQINNKINVSVYLSDSVTDQQLTNFESKLKQLPNVKSIQYVSKDEALAQYKAEHANNLDLLKAVDEAGTNPLPASLQIEPKDTNRIQDIKTFLDRPEYMALQDPQAGTSYSGERKIAIDKIARSTSLIREAGAFGVILFAFISALIIFNTLKMAIFNRRDEITIMRLLGASTWFIRGPFVVESIFYGVISAILSVLFIKGVFLAASTTLQATSFGLLDIGYANTFFSSHIWLLLTIQLSVGILLGAVSSIIATRKHLKYKTAK